MQTSRLFPDWMLAVFAAVLLLFVAVGVIWFVTQLDPFAVLYLAFAGAGFWFVLRVSRGFNDPTQNFVELGQTGITISIFRPSWPIFPGWSRPLTLAVAYSDVATVNETAARFPHGYVAWPYTVYRDHVDVVLRKRRRVPQVWGFVWPWTMTLHLDIGDRHAFVAELRERISVASDSANAP